MRPSLRSASLCVAALGVALGAIVVPIAVHNRTPDVVELVAGLTLIACGADLIASAETHLGGSLLVLAGAAWFAPDLADTHVGPGDRVLAGLQLGHVPLLAAAILVAGGRPRSALARAALGCATLTAVTGALGGHRLALPFTGTVLVIATLWTAWRNGRRSARAALAFVLAGLAYGGVLIGIAAARGLRPETDEALLGHLYAAVVAASAVLVAVAGPWLQSFYVIDVGTDRLRAFDRLIAEMVGDRSSHTVVLGGDGQWRDVTGAVDDLALGCVTEVADRVGIASASALDGRIERLSAPLLEGLLLIGRNVRLRLSAREHLDDLVTLRRRLVTVDREERAALVRRLRLGPFTLLDEVRYHLEAAGAADLGAAVDETVHELEALAGGLDALGNRSVARAISDLAAACPAEVEVHVADVALTGDGAAGLWFACSEALANAVKHAMGARVSVSLAEQGERVRLVVEDNGPGGVDVEGGGLAGVTARLEAIAGDLRIESGHTGTRITASVPSGATQRHASQPGARAEALKRAEPQRSGDPVAEAAP